MKEIVCKEVFGFLVFLVFGFCLLNRKQGHAKVGEGGRKKWGGFRTAAGQS